MAIFNYLLFCFTTTKYDCLSFADLLYNDEHLWEE